MSLAIWLLVLVPVVPLGPRVGMSVAAAAAVLATGMLLVAVVDRWTRRFSLRIDRSGFLLRRYRLWFLRTRAQRFSLEWRLDVDEDWNGGDGAWLSLWPSRRLEAEKARGLGGGVNFGPDKDSPALRAVFEEMAAAVRRAREEVSSRDTGREREGRSGDVAMLWDRVDACSVVRGPWGRVRSMRLARGAMVSGWRLPPGTVVEFGFADDWQSPRTPDRVTRVTLGGVAVWSGLPAMVRAGARIDLDLRRRVTRLEGAFEGPVRIQCVLVEGLAAISFDERGALTGCSLGEDLSWGPVRLPTGTAVHRGSWGLSFLGAGIRLEHEPEARPTQVQAMLLRAARRSTLAELLARPEGKLGPWLSVCNHEGDPVHKHRSVLFDPSAPPRR